MGSPDDNRRDKLTPHDEQEFDYPGVHFIKKRRLALGLTQRELAARTRGQVSNVAIHFIESGKTPGPRLTMLMALADGLGVRLSELLQPLDRPVRRQRS